MEKKYPNQSYGKGLQNLGRGYYFEPSTQKIYQKKHNQIFIPVKMNDLEKKVGNIEWIEN